MGFLIVFLIPGIVILSVALGAMYGHPNLAIWAPWIVGYVFVPIIQTYWPREPFHPSPAQTASAGWTAFYRILPLLALPAQIAMLAVTTAAFVSGRYDVFGRILLTITTGVFSAMFAVNIAHELIHRREKLDALRNAVIAFASPEAIAEQVPPAAQPLPVRPALAMAPPASSFHLTSASGNTLKIKANMKLVTITMTSKFST